MLVVADGADNDDVMIGVTTDSAAAAEALPTPNAATEEAFVVDATIVTIAVATATIVAATLLLVVEIFIYGFVIEDIGTSRLFYCV